jgi:hypothetical protein
LARSTAIRRASNTRSLRDETLSDVGSQLAVPIFYVCLKRNLKLHQQHLRRGRIVPVPNKFANDLALAKYIPSGLCYVAFS